MRLEDLTWTCHICKEERPDPVISVHKSERQIQGLSVVQNVRYCNDRPDCIAAAPTYSFWDRETP
jgi:hypothetical protein